MKSFEAAEIELQLQLKRVCGSDGKERDVTKSAVILNKFGLLYQIKCPDKVSLIRSAALLNAAIVRQPANEMFQQNLHQLCKHVLKCANAAQKDADVIEISRTVAARIQEI